MFEVYKIAVFLIQAFIKLRIILTKNILCVEKNVFRKSTNTMHIICSVTSYNCYNYYKSQMIFFNKFLVIGKK